MRIAIALILVTAAAVVLLMLATVSRGEIFRYVDSYGTVSFTDDVKKIPAAYKDVAGKVILEGEFKTLGSLTIVTVTPEITIPGIEEGSEFVEPCDGVITVTSERRQFGDFNRTVYSVRDECGNLVSETFSQPEVNVQR